MKTQCDMCHKQVGSVFCYTEEMALCSQCDHNKPDHQHFSISYDPVQKHIPICDICMETKAFIFCMEHRAITCRTCDSLQHKLASRHSRFLLTGAMISCNDHDNNNNNNESKNSSPTQTLLDDPYGLCKKMGTGASNFEDTDLGSYLKSLSP